MKEYILQSGERDSFGDVRWMQVRRRDDIAGLGDYMIEVIKRDNLPKDQPFRIILEETVWSTN